MQKGAEDTLANIKRESTAAIDEARKLAEQIEARARRTAAKISVDAAQKQFRDAQKPLGIQIVIWTLASIISLAFFGFLIMRFLEVKLPEGWSWQVIYYTAIRFAALAAVGSVAAYCMRILKAQLHMYQLNQHRQRVTNSVEAFVESAVTPEQRDLILGRLVDAVVSFGNSGLLQGETASDGIGPKLTIDSITRSILTPPKESPAK